MYEERRASTRKRMVCGVHVYGCICVCCFCCCCCCDMICGFWVNICIACKVCMVSVLIGCDVGCPQIQQRWK